MTCKALALAVLATLIALVGGTGRAQAARGTYRITVGGNSIIGWWPDSGAIDQTSDDKLSASGTLVSASPLQGAIGTADYEVAAGPGVLRAKIDGSFTVPSDLSYPFTPTMQAVSTTELTVSGPDGFVNTSLNVHVDGIIETPVCGGRDSCGAENVSISVGPFTRVSEFDTLPETRANGLGLSFDPVPGGYRVHGDVTSAPLGIRTNTPYPVTVTLNLSGAYAGSPTPTTIGGTFDDPAALYQVSFAPTGPVLNDIPTGYTVSGPSVVDNHWTDPFATPPADVIVTNCADSALAGLTSVSGNLVFRNLAGCPEISMPNLKSVAGDLIVEGTDATRIAFPGPVIVDGSVRIVDNDSATEVSMGSDEAGSVSVSGDLDISQAAGSADIDVGNGQIGGSLAITDTGSGVVDIRAGVSGDMTIETGGDPLSATTAGGTTDVTILGGTATMHVGLPKEAFAQPVGFTISRHTDPSGTGTAADGTAAVIDPIFSFEFAFDVPTLNADAQLSFVVDMSQLDAAGRADLLNALASGTATIAGKGDADGSTYQAFAVCSGMQTPTADHCVAISILAADGTPTTGNPAFVRFDGVVGHFSTYAVATVGSVDNTPPVVTVPVDLAIDATSPEGAKVTYTASATDAVDLSPNLVCVPASGRTFPIGTTTVTCTATDASGNSASGRFDVRVRGAGEQIVRLINKTLAYLDRPSLRPALQAQLQAVAHALVSQHLKTACLALDVYIAAVKIAPAQAFTQAEKTDLIADARRTKAVIGC